MLAIPGVQHRAIDLFRNQPHRARTGMTNHDRIGAHRIQRHRRVDQRFALFHARLRGVHVDDVRAETFTRNFEAEQCPRRIFEERIDLRQAVKTVVRFPVSAVVIDPLIGFIDQERNLMRLETRDTSEVAMGKRQCH